MQARQHGIRKIIPDQDLLARTHEAAVRTMEVREAVACVLRETATPVTVAICVKRWRRGVRIIAEREDGE